VKSEKWRVKSEKWRVKKLKSQLLEVSNKKDDSDETEDVAVHEIR
jgi:hypothetical protein